MISIGSRNVTLIGSVLDRTYGLDLYDFEARQYDAQGHSIDSFNNSVDEIQERIIK